MGSSVLLQRGLSGKRSQEPRDHPTPIIQPVLLELTPALQGLPLHFALRAAAAPLCRRGGRNQEGEPGAPPPPPLAETDKCPPCAKQTIIGLALPGAIGITNATHANCPPRVATRLFVGPARTAQHGRTATARCGWRALRSEMQQTRR